MSILDHYMANEKDTESEEQDIFNTNEEVALGKFRFERAEEEGDDGTERKRHQPKVILNEEYFKNRTIPGQEEEEKGEEDIEPENEQEEKEEENSVESEKEEEKSEEEN